MTSVLQKTWHRKPHPSWSKINLPFTATVRERRQAALSYYYATGDAGPANDLGLNLPDQQNVWKAVDEATGLMKAGPPGPPPRPGLRWKPETSRWIRPDGSERTVAEEADQEHSWKKPREETPAAAGYSSTFIPGYPIERPVPTVMTKSDLDDRGRYAVGAYTGISSESLNRHMREGRELSETAQRIVGPLLELSRPLGDNVHTVYRGVSGGVEGFEQHLLREDLVPGVSLPIDSFMSTSRDPSVAMSFHSAGTGFMLEIHPSRDAEAAVLGDNFDNRTERETIFTPGHQLVVREVHRNVPAPNFSRQPVPYYIVATVEPGGR